MFNKVILLLCCAALCLTCGIKPYNKDQYASCFAAYSDAYEICTDDICKDKVLKAYKACTGDNLKIPLHFVVLTKKLRDSITSPNATYELNSNHGSRVTGSIATNKNFISKDDLVDFLKSEVDTLNRWFTVENSAYGPDNREKIVTFEYKSSTLFGEAKKFNDPIVVLNDPVFDFDLRHSDFNPAVNSTTHTELYDPNAVNVYIVDTALIDSSGTIDDVNSSHGKNNCDKPYIVLDYKRILGIKNRQGAEEHEMGHAFGLAHICDPTADDIGDPTNIMASSGNYPENGSLKNNDHKDCRDPKDYVESIDCPSDSGGNRAIGFDHDQCLIITEKVNAFLAKIQ